MPYFQKLQKILIRRLFFGNTVVDFESFLNSWDWQNSGNYLLEAWNVRWEVVNEFKFTRINKLNFIFISYGNKKMLKIIIFFLIKLYNIVCLLLNVLLKHGIYSSFLLALFLNNRGRRGKTG